ncbi:MAG: DUF2892 domain-containing protein [Micropepsaceae bacterium]
MFKRNLPAWERRARTIAGLAMVAGGLIAFPADPVGYIIAAAGAGAVLSGLMGYCPACAVMGRATPQT